MCENNLERDAAKQSWNTHLSLDDSIIVDLFQVYRLDSNFGFLKFLQIKKKFLRAFISQL